MDINKLIKVTAIVIFLLMMASVAFSKEILPPENLQVVDCTEVDCDGLVIRHEPEEELASVTSDGTLYILGKEYEKLSDAESKAVIKELHDLIQLQMKKLEEDKFLFEQTDYLLKQLYECKGGV